MKNGEQKVLWFGVTAGTILGLAIGLMVALFIAMKPGLIH
jgi:tetrahydromethanopterin S-methyltransferase subunit F